MAELETKTIFTFTKDIGKHTIELEGYNEVTGPQGGFSVINVASVDLEYKISENTSIARVEIFLKNSKGDIVAKNHIWGFKDNDSLILKNVFCIGYQFELINGGV